MISFDMMTEALAGFTYKPGWEIQLVNVPMVGPYVRIVTEQPNYAASGTTELGIDVPIPPMQSTDQFIEWLVWRLAVAEVHECWEAARWNGQPVFEAHGDIGVWL